jgi:hypothetical protein
MSTDEMNAEDQHHYISWQKSHRRGKIAAGIIIVFYGVLFLLKETGNLAPGWDVAFTAGPIIIAIGLIALIKHKFKLVFGYFLLLVGKLFLLHEFYPEAISIKLLWPILVIFIGLALVFRSRKGPRMAQYRRRCDRHHHHRHNRPFWKHDPDFFEKAEALDNIAADDFIDAVSIFGGVQKNVVSKTFRGADIVTIFGGNDLNLSQADFKEQIVMDVTNIFGGTTLTIPNNWQIKSEIVTIFGSLEDKRPITPKEHDEASKIVILKGTCLFGGIEINSFN